MLPYYLKYRKNTESKNSKLAKKKQKKQKKTGTRMLLSKCAVCNSKK